MSSYTGNIKPEQSRPAATERTQVLSAPTVTVYPSRKIEDTQLFIKALQSIPGFKKLETRSNNFVIYFDRDVSETEITKVYETFSNREHKDRVHAATGTKVQSEGPSFPNPYKVIGKTYIEEKDSRTVQSGGSNFPTPPAMPSSSASTGTPEKYTYRIPYTIIENRSRLIDVVKAMAGYENMSVTNRWPVETYNFEFTKETSGEEILREYERHLDRSEINYDCQGRRKDFFEYQREKRQRAATSDTRSRGK